MSEYDDLKRLAQAAWDEQKANTDKAMKGMGSPCTYRFDCLVASFSPAFILDLIANYTRAQSAATEQAKHLDAISNALNADISADGEALVGMVRELVTDNERLRMQLTACGVVAMSNTRESAERQREMHPDYMSASCQDVIRAVDSEMDLREERDQLKAENEGLRRDAARFQWCNTKGNWVSQMFGKWRAHTGGDYGNEAPTKYYLTRGEAIDAAMAKEQQP